jgi:hypothetical protein
MAGTRSLVTDVTDVTDRPVGGPAALLAALGVAIPSARPTESSPAAAAGVDVVVADADVVAADGVDAVVAADANHSDRPAPRDAVDTAVRPDLPIGEAKSDASTDGSVSAGPEVEGVRTLTTDVPPWADRPTAGFPTVPVSAGLHPTWVAASREPAVAPREIVRTSTVGAAGSAFGPPVTHSRATFGRMRRRATNLADSDRPQQTPTTRSNAKTTEGA